MKCRECGYKTRETFGVHYIDGKWLLIKANYCFRHGSFVTPQALSQAEEVVPDPTVRDHIRPGLHVGIVLKEHQASKRITEGYVATVLTNSFVHNRGIKVKLQNGKIGRVQLIMK